MMVLVMVVVVTMTVVVMRRTFQEEVGESFGKEGELRPCRLRAARTFMQLLKFAMIDNDHDDDDCDNDDDENRRDIDIEDDDLFDNDDDENKWIDIDDDDSNPTASRKAVDSRAGSSTQSTNL